MKPRINPETNPAIKPKSTLRWIFESLEDDPRFVLRKLFSFDAAYLDGRLYLAAAGGSEPWNGLMVCTAREHHSSIQNQYPQLVSHQVLGKWLYLSQSHPEFETIAIELADLARRRDPRLGVDAKPRKQKGEPRPSGPNKLNRRLTGTERT
jgi:hypothetical protein